MNQQSGDQQKRRRFAGVKRSGSVYGELQLREERFRQSVLMRRNWTREFVDNGSEHLLACQVVFFLILSTNDIQRV